MAASFLPDGFTPPTALDGDGFRLEPLGPEHNERDHDAWMSSIDHIHDTPGFEKSTWPEPMTLEANRADLERHAADFVDHTGFTYSILDGDEVIGCVYIYPARSDGSDALVSSWVRESRSGMDVAVWQALSAWIADEWPFESAEYAPREAS